MPGLLEMPQDSVIKSGNSTVSLFVSVYLLLLAFFVILNSISNQERARAGAVLESVDTSFKKQYQPRADKLEIAASPDAVTLRDEFQDELSGTLASITEIPTFHPTKGGNIFQISLPIDALFAPGSARIREDRRVFVGELANILRQRHPTYVRDLRYTFPLRTSGRRAAQETVFQSARAIAFAEALEIAGVPPSVLVAGIAPRRNDHIELRFGIRQLDSQN